MPNLMRGECGRLLKVSEYLTSVEKIVELSALPLNPTWNTNLNLLRFKRIGQLLPSTPLWHARCLNQRIRSSLAGVENPLRVAALRLCKGDFITCGNSQS